MERVMDDGDAVKMVRVRMLPQLPTSSVSAEALRVSIAELIGAYQAYELARLARQAVERRGRAA